LELREAIGDNIVILWKQLLISLAAPLVVLNVVSTQAQPMNPFPNVSSLLLNSDLVVEGRIISQGKSQNNGAAKRLALRIDRTIKGKPPKNVQQINLLLNNTSLQDQYYGIFFLKAISSGDYDVVDPHHPSVPACPNRSATARGSGEALAVITTELTEVLAAPPATLNKLLPKPNTYLSTAADDAYTQASYALKDLPADLKQSSLNVIASSSSIAVRQRLRAQTLLLALGDWNNWGWAQPYLLKPTPDIIIEVQNLSSEMPGHIDRKKLIPQAVPKISALLRSTNIAVRQAAAQTLREIATRDVIQPLIEVGLNDQDERVRYFAATGLANATGMHTHYLGTGQWRTAEKKELDFWHQWAKSNRSINIRS